MKISDRLKQAGKTSGFKSDNTELDLIFNLLLPMMDWNSNDSELGEEFQQRKQNEIIDLIKQYRDAEIAKYLKEIDPNGGNI